MKKMKNRAAILLAACLAAACGEPVVVAKGEPYGPLMLRIDALRSDPTFVHATQSVRATPRDSGPRGDAGSHGAQANVAGSDELAQFTRQEFETGFVASQNAAYAQMITGFIGNVLRHSINMSLTINGAPVPLFPFTEQWSWPLTMHYEASSTMSIGGIETCGHRVHGSGTRRAWTQLWLPAAPSTEVLAVEATQVSPAPTEQVSCPPQRTEKDELSPVGGAIGGKPTDEVQWYLCRFEVWIDAGGNEVSRRLLYCTPL